MFIGHLLKSFSEDFLEINKVLLNGPLPRTIRYVMSESEAKKLLEELKQWAAVNGKTQSDVARLLDVDKQRVNDWFHGRRIPTLDSGIRILRLLKKLRK